MTTRLELQDSEVKEVISGGSGVLSGLSLLSLGLLGHAVVGGAFLHVLVVRLVFLVVHEEDDEVGKEGDGLGPEPGAESGEDVVDFFGAGVTNDGSLEHDPEVDPVESEEVEEPDSGQRPAVPEAVHELEEAWDEQAEEPPNRDGGHEGLVKEVEGPHVDDAEETGDDAIASEGHLVGSVP